MPLCCFFLGKVPPIGGFCVLRSFLPPTLLRGGFCVFCTFAILRKNSPVSDFISCSGLYRRKGIFHRRVDENIFRTDRPVWCFCCAITPYRDQVTAIRKQLGDTYEVDTVHKFQGREQDAIILTSVDNVITDFVDDPHMLNVAVSRAVHSLAVITSQDPRNDQTNYGDLTRYIEYNNFEVIQSQVYSVFDMLYQGYAEQRRAYLQKHKRVSEYDSENLMYSVIQEVLSEEAFSSIGCAVHLSLATLVKNYEPLTEEERKYARNPLTHVDFLLFNQMDKQPMLAIEVDGTGFHEAGSKQAERDIKKNSILEKCAVPLLRLRTDGSGEKEKIKNALKRE